MHQLGELDPGTRCMGVFFCAAAGAASSAAAGARHTPERAQGKAGAAQPLAAELPHALAWACSSRMRSITG